IDLIVPFMSMLQLIFQMSWLKVAEALLNPFGEDDDDFECNYIIDRNISIALTMVGQTFDDVPEQFRDKFDKEEKPLYSEETAKLGTRALIGSVARVAMENEEEKVKMIPREPIEEPARKRAETRSQSIDLTGLTNRLSIKHLKSRLQQNRSQSLSLESGQKGPLASPNLKNWRQNPDLPLETPKSPTSPTIHYLEEIAEENPAFDFYDENFEEKKP
uniref:Bestrophin homolog n=1 Tax=Panagrolaimus sp. JU765 TaxID=591449 RepID=A0AC34QAV3_9BILA